ncbi:MAG: hypothetical protein KJ065_28150, partial [Anaerolineae bacterium]|nr:hypothetical protein [Anaerolineae bacterium]
MSSPRNHMRFTILVLLLFVLQPALSQDLNACEIILDSAISVERHPDYGASEIESYIIPVGSLIEFVGKTPDNAHWIVRHNASYVLFNMRQSTLNPLGCRVPFWGVPEPDYRPIQDILTEIGVDAWHMEGHFGQGVRVGVLDARFDGVDDLIADTGVAPERIKLAQPLEQLAVDLPAAQSTEAYHGTKVLEVLLTIAPQAEYILARAIDAETFASSVEALITADVDVIVHAGNVITTNPESYRDIVRQAVNTFGVLWINSAGNLGAGYYPGRFSGGGTLGSPLHRFDDPNVMGDAQDTLSVAVDKSQVVRVTLMWEDPSASFSLIVLGSCNPNDTNTFAPIIGDAIQGQQQVEVVISRSQLQQIGDYRSVPRAGELQRCEYEPDGIPDNEIYLAVRDAEGSATTGTRFDLYVHGAISSD